MLKRIEIFIYSGFLFFLFSKSYLRGSASITRALFLKNLFQILLKALRTHDFFNAFQMFLRYRVALRTIIKWLLVWCFFGVKMIIWFINLWWIILRSLTSVEVLDFRSSHFLFLMHHKGIPWKGIEEVLGAQLWVNYMWFTLVIWRDRQLNLSIRTYASLIVALPDIHVELLLSLAIFRLIKLIVTNGLQRTHQGFFFMFLFNVIHQ